MYPLELESTDQHDPAWSPDGKWIAYTRYNGRGWEIAKAPSGGRGRPIRICDGGAYNGGTGWSASGQWIGFLDDAGLHVVSADASTPSRLILKDASGFDFSKRGDEIYAVLESEDRRWELLTLSVPDGAQKKAVQLNLPAGASINEISLHPSGNKFAATSGSAKRDIWILDGLRPPASYFSRWPWTTVNVFDVLGSVRINQRSGVLLAR